MAISGSDKIALALALLSIGTAGAMYILPHPYSDYIGYASIAICVLALIWLAIHHFKSRFRVLTGIVTAIAVALIAWYFWPISVHAGFSDLYADYSLQLGKATRPAELSSQLDQYWHDGGLVLYPHDLLTAYAIPINLTKKAVKQPDPFWDAPRTDCDEAAIRRNWKGPPAPAGKKYPICGVFRYWDKWPWLGWRRSNCGYVRQVSFQKFEHGIIIGPVLLSEETPATENIAILDDGTWQPRLSTTRFEQRKCN
jgi:hypothetical protein